MQAIRTTYKGPSSTQNSRFFAKCAAGSITVPYDHELDAQGNHEAACKALCVKLGWTDENGYTNTVSGGLDDGSFVHVFLPREVKA